MPRTSRTVAQRLAAQQAKSRRRRVTRGSEALPPEVENLLDEPAPLVDAEPVTPSRTVARSTAPPLPRAAPRRYAEYSAEYTYVSADLRRIVLVAGGLLFLLVILSLFIR